MKKALLFLLLILCNSFYAQTETEIKNAIKAAKKEIEDEATKAKKKSMIPKIQFDTITSRSDFQSNNTRIIEKDVKDGYYMVKYVNGDEAARTNYIKLRDAFLKLKETDNGYAAAKSAFEKANIFKVYYSVALPDDPVRIETINYFPSYNILTIPFKIHPKRSGLESQSNGAIDNLGIYMAWNYKIEKLFFDKTTSTHKWGAGIYVAPSVVELTEANTGITGFKTSKEIYLTTAFAISYSYNKITFVASPVGFDCGFSDTAKKWNYDGHYWWGFGIGVDTSLFNF